MLEEYEQFDDYLEMVVQFGVRIFLKNSIFPKNCILCKPILYLIHMFFPTVLFLSVKVMRNNVSH